MEETEVVCNKLSEEHSALLGTTIHTDELKRRFSVYDSVTSNLQKLLITGCYWGEAKHQDQWINCLEQVANDVEQRIRELDWNNSHIITGDRDLIHIVYFYPVFLLLYAAGIASIARKRYDTFAALLTQTIVRREGKEKPLVLSLERWYHFLGPQSPNNPQKATPPTESFFNSLRTPFKEFLRQDIQYQKCFNRFEYLLALVCADLYEKENNRVIGTLGHLARLFPSLLDPFSHNEQYESELIREIKTEAARANNDWLPLQAGLFDGSIDRFNTIAQKFTEFATSDSSKRKIQFYYGYYS